MLFPAVCVVSDMFPAAEIIDSAVVPVLSSVSPRNPRLVSTLPVNVFVVVLVALILEQVIRPDVIVLVPKSNPLCTVIGAKLPVFLINVVSTVPHVTLPPDIDPVPQVTPVGFDV